MGSCPWGEAQCNRRDKMGTRWAYARWMHSCSSRLGSNMLTTSNGGRVRPDVVAMGLPALPWEWAFAGGSATERRPVESRSVSGAKAAARDVLLQLKLYHQFCNIVGGVITPPCG